MLQSIQNLSLTPIEYLGPIRDLPDDDTLILESAKRRLIFIAQVISTSLMLTIILFVGLLEGSAESFKDKENETFTLLGNCIKYHLIYVVPSSLVGILAPSITTKSCMITFHDCYKANAIALKKIDSQTMPETPAQPQVIV